MNFLERVILSPIVTEKAVSRKGEGVYTFRVKSDATKVDIKNAVSKLFNVKAIDVNTVHIKGKKRGAIRGKIGTTKSWKKAYVKLAPGQKIESLEA